MVNIMIVSERKQFIGSQPYEKVFLRSVESYYADSWLEIRPLWLTTKDRTLNHQCQFHLRLIIETVRSISELL